MIRSEGPGARGVFIRRDCPTGSGFSLVEVVFAMGLVAFGVLVLLALLPIGVTSNGVAVSESEAVNILSCAEADLRDPFDASGNSSIFGLEAPYLAKAAKAPLTGMTLAFNQAPSLNSLYTTGLTEAEVPVKAAPGVRYQLSIIYTKIPPVGSLASAEARLVVNWPCLPATATVGDVTNLSKVSNFVEAYVTFPAP